MSLKTAKKVTSEFHALQKKLEEARSKGEKEQLTAEVEALRPAYQTASIVNTTAFKGTSRWVCQQLTALGRKPKK